MVELAVYTALASAQYYRHIDFCSPMPTVVCSAFLSLVFALIFFGLSHHRLIGFFATLYNTRNYMFSVFKIRMIKRVYGQFYPENITGQIILGIFS
jgi:hypothetical protein